MKRIIALLIITALCSCGKDNDTVPTVIDTVKYEKPPIKDKEPKPGVGVIPWDGNKQP